MYCIVFTRHGTGIWALFPFCCCEWCCYKHPCTVFSTSFQFFWVYVSRSGIAGSHGNSVSDLLRNCQLFPAVATLHSQWQCLRVSLHPCQHLLFYLFFSSCYCQSRGVISHGFCLAFPGWSLFMCLFAICVSYLEKYLLKSFANSVIGLSFFPVLYIFQILAFYQICNLQFFFHPVCCSFILFFSFLFF